MLAIGIFWLSERMGFEPLTAFGRPSLPATKEELLSNLSARSEGAGTQEPRSLWLDQVPLQSQWYFQHFTLNYCNNLTRCNTFFCQNFNRFCKLNIIFLLCKNIKNMFYKYIRTHFERWGFWLGDLPKKLASI